MRINHPWLSVHSHLAQGWSLQPPDTTDTCHLDHQPWSCQGSDQPLSHLTWFSGVCILHSHSHQQSMSEGAPVSGVYPYNMPTHEPAAYHLPSTQLWGSQTAAGCRVLRRELHKKSSESSEGSHGPCTKPRQLHLPSAPHPTHHPGASTTPS